MEPTRHNGITDTAWGEGSRSCTDPPHCMAERSRSSGTVEFMRLPEIVWLRVMLFLPLCDRYHMTLSCALFHQLFFHPALWRSVDLVCFLWWGWGRRRERGGGGGRLTLKPSHKKIALQFGHLFQHVSLHVSHAAHPVEEETASILFQLAENAGLRGLTLTTDFSSHWQTVEPQGDPQYSPLDAAAGSVRSGQGVVVDMLTRAKGLLFLDVSRWPLLSSSSAVGGLLQEGEVNVLSALERPDTCPGLRSLNVAVKILPLSSDLREMLRPTAVRLLTKFVHLRHLHVRQRMLSDFLLHELASGSRAGPMRKLTVVNCDPLPEDGEKDVDVDVAAGVDVMPQLCEASWSKLRSACPQLELHVLAEVAHVPCITWVMTPHVPLVSLQLRYCSLPVGVLSGLQQCWATLRSLSFHVLPAPGHDRPLVHLASVCTRLHHLVFYGKIHACTIIDLASLDRQWRTFRFRLKHIDLGETETDIGERGDGVVRFGDGVGETDREVVASAGVVRCGVGGVQVGERDRGVVASAGVVRSAAGVGMTDGGFITSAGVVRSGVCRVQQVGERDRQERLNRLCEDVSSRLGYTWRPCQL